eukprot:365028-Chlamydomonas_euryale.AAC.11
MLQLLQKLLMMYWYSRNVAACTHMYLTQSRIRITSVRGWAQHAFCRCIQHNFGQWCIDAIVNAPVCIIGHLGLLQFTQAYPSWVPSL